MKKIYCLSLLLCANAMMFASQEQQIRPQRQELKKSPIQGKKDPSFQNGQGSRFGKMYCKNQKDKFPYFADSGQNHCQRY